MIKENKNDQEKSAFTEVPSDGTLEKSIHTMEEDLNGGALVQAATPLPQKEKEKESPFLNKNEWNNKREEQVKNPLANIVKSNLDGNLNKKEDIQIKKNEEQKDSSSGIEKAIMFAIAVALLILIGVGGYYFWMTGVKNKNNTVVPVIPQEDSAPEETAQTEEIALSSENPNIIQLDLVGTDALQIKKVLQEKAKEVAQLRISTPVEFVVRDEQNNPIKFNDFTEKVGMTFSPATQNLFGDEFSLFVYNDNGNIRLGSVISLIAGANVDAIIKGEEKNLTQVLSPLYLDIQYTLRDNVVFQTSFYNKKTVRYLNVVSPEDLSIDYSVFNNKWVIGTTKMTLRSILDYIDRKTEQSVDLDILNSVSNEKNIKSDETVDTSVSQSQDLEVTSSVSQENSNTSNSSSTSSSSQLEISSE
jgi:hypothetical protein